MIARLNAMEIFAVDRNPLPSRVTATTASGKHKVCYHKWCFYQQADTTEASRRREKPINFAVHDMAEIFIIFSSARLGCDKNSSAEREPTTAERCGKDSSLLIRLKNIVCAVNQKRNFFVLLVIEIL